MITSTSNPKIKWARALRHRKYREANQAFLVEGIHHLGAALEAGAELEAVFYAPDLLTSEFANRLLDEAERRKIPCHATSQEAFASLADKENPQGILAVARMPVHRLSEFTPVNFSWGVAVVAPQDPGNVGAILRTIDAVGVDGLILIDEGVDAYHPTAVRASLGAIFRRPVIPVTFTEFSRWTAEYGYHVVGSSAHAAQDYRQADLSRRPLILLMGSERQGLSQEQLSICEAVVCIPMRGKVTSLNLAVAAGILLYEVLQQSEP